MKKRYTSPSKNWFRSSLVLLFAAFLSVHLEAQTGPAKIWDKAFGGSNIEGIGSVQQTSDGGYILGGSSNSGISGDKSQANQGGFDGWVVKLDGSSNIIWDKTFGGSGDDRISSLQQTTDGGYILGGTSDSGISGDKSQASKGGRDFWVIKLDTSGTKLWDKTIGGSGDDRLSSIQQTADGGYILGGQSSSGISGDKSQNSQGGIDYWVVKLDASGNKLWDKTIGGSDDDELRSLQLTTNGDYILGGLSSSGISGDKTQANRGVNSDDYWIVKLNSNGTKIWDKTLGGSANDRLNCLVQTSDGGYLLGGLSTSDVSGDKTQPMIGDVDGWLVKLDASGNKSWDKSYCSGGEYRIHTLKQTSDGGYIHGGTTDSGGNGHDDFRVMKVNALGNITWSMGFGGIDNEGLSSLQQTSEGGYILAGHSWSGTSGNKTSPSKGGCDFWAVKLAPIVPNDVAATAITSVNSSCSLTNQETITITVHNIGTASQSNIPVSYKINGGALVPEVIPGPVAPNTTVTFSFSTKANLSALGTYAIEARTNLTGDASPSNDIATKTVTNYAYAVPNTPTITNSGSSALCGGSAVTLTAVSTTTGVTYQWFVDGMAISGATSASYSTNAAGSYTATAIIGGSCASPASAATVLTMNSIPPAPAITALGSLIFCSGDSVALTATSPVSGATYIWFKNGNVITGATSATYMAKSAGSYTVAVTSNGCTGAASIASNVTISQLPATPTITQTGSVLTSSSTTGNQWYKDNVAISGATSQTYTTSSNGSYTVVVTDNGCTSQASNAVVISTTGLREEKNALNVAVYPNPSMGLFSITLPEGSSNELTVTDLTGKVIRQLTTKDKNTQLNLSNAAKGVYLLQITGEGKTVIRKLVLE